MTRKITSASVLSALLLGCLVGPALAKAKAPKTEKITIVITGTATETSGGPCSIPPAGYEDQCLATPPATGCGCATAPDATATSTFFGKGATVPVFEVTTNTAASSNTNGDSAPPGCSPVFGVVEISTGPSAKVAGSITVNIAAVECTPPASAKTQDSSIVGGFSILSGTGADSSLTTTGTVSGSRDLTTEALSLKLEASVTVP